ncbi:MAG TPA: sugar kinase, partial [Nitrososphaerales archaeon]|nr:sugar kinase [Nitrososphaerales archaeon]
ASPRPTAVIYDRKYSAASMMKPGEIDWSFLKDVKLFHTTGITPALSPTAREATLEAIDAAKKAGCKISMDINYRAKLWSTKEAEATMTPLAEKLDVLFTTDEDTWRVWNMKGTPEEIITGLKDRFHIPVVAITIREIVTVLKNRWSSMVYADKIYKSKRVYDVEIVDRIGSGDSFAAGFIYGYLNGDIQMGVDYGDVMAAFKHSIPGDSNYMAKDEVDQAVKANSDLRIQR